MIYNEIHRPGKNVFIASIINQIKESNRFWLWGTSQYDRIKPGKTNAPSTITPNVAIQSVKTLTRNETWLQWILPPASLSCLFPLRVVFCIPLNST